MVCHPKLRGDVSITALVDSVDHNPSSTTSKESLIGTGVSFLQHPVFADQGVNRRIVIAGGASSQKTVRHLPSLSIDVPQRRHLYHLAPWHLWACGNMTRTSCWLENVRKILALASDDEENVVNQSVEIMSWVV